MVKRKSALLGRLSDIDIRLLHVFRIVVECGSYATAEVELNINRSTISIHISDLETRLGMPLLIRSRGRSGLALTEQGQQVYEASRDLFGMLEGVRDRINAIQLNLTGNLHICLPDDWLKIEELDLSVVIKEFCQQAPEVELKVGTYAPDEMDFNILSGKADISINAVHLIRPGLEYFDLFKHRTYLYCGAKNSLFGIAEDDLDIETILACKLVGSGHAVSPDISRYYGMFENRSIANHMDGRMLMILSGTFVGFLPEYYAREWEKRGEVRRLKPDEFSYQMQNSLVYKKGAKENPLVDLFISEIKKQLC